MKTPSDFILDCFINSTTDAILQSDLPAEKQAELLVDIENRFQMKLSNKLRKDINIS